MLQPLVAILAGFVSSKVDAELDLTISVDVLVVPPPLGIPLLPQLTLQVYNCVLAERNMIYFEGAPFVPD